MPVKPVSQDKRGDYGCQQAHQYQRDINILLNQAEALLEPAKYQEVSEKIKTFASPDAADKIAAVLLGQGA